MDKNPKLVPKAVRDRYHAIFNSLKWDAEYSFVVVEYDINDCVLPIDHALQKKCGDAAIMAIATSIEKFKDACKKAGL